MWHDSQRSKVSKQARDRCMTHRSIYRLYRVNITHKATYRPIVLFVWYYTKLFI